MAGEVNQKITGEVLSPGLGDDRTHTSKEAEEGMGESREWWCLPIVLALRGLRQGDCKFKPYLGNLVT